MSGARQFFCIETNLVQKVVYIQSNFAVVFQIIHYTLASEMFVAICIDFIKDFTYLQHFYFSKNADVKGTIQCKN